MSVRVRVYPASSFTLRTRFYPGKVKPSADAVKICPRGRRGASARIWGVRAHAPQRQRRHGASAWTHPSVSADMGVHADAPRSRVVTRTITDGRTGGRSGDGRRGIRGLDAL
jgi:hypothetical protein